MRVYLKKRERQIQYSGMGCMKKKKKNQQTKTTIWMNWTYMKKMENRLQMLKQRSMLKMEQLPHQKPQTMKKAHTLLRWRVLHGHYLRTYLNTDTI